MKLLPLAWLEMGLLLLGVALLFPKNLPGQEAQYKRAQQLAYAGKHQEAAQTLDSLLEAHPDYLPAEILRAHNLAWSRQYDLAIYAFRQILDAHPQNVEAWIGLGYAYAWSGDLDNSFFPFRQALRFEPGNFDARKGLAYTYITKGNGRAAQRILLRLLGENPEREDIYIALAQSYMVENRDRKAQEVLDQVLILNPDNPDAHTLLKVLKGKSTLAEFDVWGGWSDIDGETKTGLRMVQASWQFSYALTAYARYDNTLSLDNLDFILQRQQSSSIIAGALWGWDERYATRFEYGPRFFSNRDLQHQFRIEQVFFLPESFNVRIGGHYGASADFPNEWLSFMSVFLPFGNIFALEPTFYIADTGLSSGTENRLVLNGNLKTISGFEFNVGGFLGNANVEIEGAKKRIGGGYALALIPLKKRLFLQLAGNYEMGALENKTVLAAGLKLRVPNR